MPLADSLSQLVLFQVNHRENNLKLKAFFQQFFELQFISLSYIEIH